MLFYLFGVIARCILLDDIEFELYADSNLYDRVVGVIDKKLYLMKREEAEMSKANTFFSLDQFKIRQNGSKVCGWGITEKTLQMCEYVPLNSDFLIEDGPVPGFISIKTASGDQCVGYKENVNERQELALTNCFGSYKTLFRILRKSEIIPHFRYNIMPTMISPYSGSSYSANYSMSKIVRSSSPFFRSGIIS